MSKARPLVIRVAMSGSELALTAALAALSAWAGDWPLAGAANTRANPRAETTGRQRGIADS